MNGEPPETGGGRVFLGWTTGVHWLARPTG